MRTISRNPFGRYSTVRNVYSGIERECAWCGAERASARPQAGNDSPRIVRTLYAYGIERDGGSGPYWSERAFCSIDCARSYTGDPLQ